MYGQCLIACQCAHESLNSHLAVQGDSFNITHAGLQFLRELSLVVQALYSIKIQASESSQVPLCQSLSCCKCNCSSCYCCVSRLALLCSLLASSAASRAAHSSSASRLFCLSCFCGQSVFFSLSDCFCLIGDKGHCHLLQQSPMAAASDAAASTALGAPSSPNLSKRLFKGSLCDDNCCKNCSLLTRMRHLAENGNSLKLSSSAFCAASRARTAFLVASAAASLADAPLQFRASSAVSRIADPFQSSSPPLPQLLLWPVCLFSFSGCFCLIGANSLCHLLPKVTHGCCFFFAVSTALGAPSSSSTRVSSSSRATSVMLTVARAAVPLLE